MEITALGIDLGKNVFQLHGVDASGAIIMQRKVQRNALLTALSKLKPCLIGIEACPISHFLAWEIAALGHDMRLILPS